MTISAKELANQRKAIMSVPRELKKFFGPITDNEHFKILISGKTQTGKSSFLIKVANILARKDIKILYGNFEERPSVGTITNKLLELRVRNENIHFIESKQVDEFFKALDTGKYKFAIIDSLSVLYNSRKDIGAFFKKLELEYPTIPIFLVVHYNKDEKNYQGSTFLQHDVDIFWETTAGGKVITKKNRFITGKDKPTMKIWK